MRVDPRWVTVPAYNYVDVPQYEDVVTEKFTGYKKTRIPPLTKLERIAPFRRKVEVFNYETQCIYLGCFQVRVNPKFKWVPAYNYKTVPAYNYKTVPAYNYVDVPQYEDVVTEKFTGYKKTRIPPYTKSVEAFNYENQPIYKTVTKYETQYRCPADHNLNNGKCVHPTTDDDNGGGPGKNEKNPAPVDGKCPAGMHPYTQNGETRCHKDHGCPSGYYAPPLPDVVVVDINTGEYIPEDTPQYGTAITNRGIAGEWQKMDNIHDCYKAVRVQGTNIVVKIIVNGVEHVVNAGKIVIGGVEYVVTKGGKIFIDKASQAAGDIKDAIQQAAIKEIEKLRKKALTAFKLACSVPFGQAVVGGSAAYAAASTATGAAAVAGVASALSVAPAVVLIAVGVAGAVGVHYACEFVKNKYLNTDDSDTDDSNSAATGVPSVSGTVRVGETLTAGTSGVADVDGLGVFSYQWRGDGSAISGATSASYTLVAADLGKAISVAVSFTDGAGNAESVASSPTAAVAAAEDSDDEDSDDEAEPVSLSITSASCAKSGSEWVVSVSWETGEGLRTSVAVSENKAGGHYADKYSVGEFSETFDVPRWGTYSVLVFARAEDQSLLRDRASVSCPY